MDIVKDIKNLLAGMGITGKHLGRHAITIQYPEEKWTMPERSRGIVVLLSDKKTGELNCTGCELCMRACPTGAIMVHAPRDEKKKRHLKAFTIDFSLCCFCGLCEDACNFCALKMAPMYEFSTDDKESLTWDMKTLQEIGRDVDYVDTRKKKKPVKKTEAAKPAGKPADKSADKPPDKSAEPALPEAKPATEDEPTTDQPSGNETKEGEQ
ncbi:MAG: 4Fe-4S binding protein [Candidatus Zixiibacteriota bacterium]|nr:MAG: 4Fe-4S binding protein [candidate division Zixibacteria bacterium]